MASGIDIKVWGPYACFTRPEFKVERVSYPVMTPSAARGILEAIYWKPQIRYRIQRIGILKLGTQLALLRNEIKSRQNGNAKGVDYALQLLCNPQREVRKLRKGMTKDETADAIAREQFLVAEDKHVQRTSLVLQDVAYRICAWIELRDGETNIGKHLDSLRRRTEGGQCFHRPYLGCREFAADFEPTDDQADHPDPNLNLSIGTMLFDNAYIEDVAGQAAHKADHLEFWRHDAAGKARVAKGYARRLFFHAEVRNGWLDVPRDRYQELNQLEAANGIS